MKRSIGIIYILLLLILPPQSLAYEEKLAQFSQRWICVKGENEKYTFKWNAIPEITYELKGSGFPNGYTAYLIGCTQTDHDALCTSGEKTVDQLIFNADNTSLPITFSGGSKKIISYGSITSTAYIKATIANSGRITFYGVIIDSSLNENDPDKQKGLQQTSIDYLIQGDSDQSNCVNISWLIEPSPTPTPTPTPTLTPSPTLTPAPTSTPAPAVNTSGGRRSWNEMRNSRDPFGVIFDARSLEPLSNVKVTIYDQNKKILQIMGLTNPQTTKEDGLFNFLVPEGFYYLDVTPLPKGYSWAQISQMHPNYKYIYYKANGDSSIYQPGEIIAEIIDTNEEKQQGYANPERRDIPLDPGANPPSKTLPKIMLYSTSRYGSNMLFQGRVSHPFTKIILQQNGKTLESQYSDRMGFFAVLVKNKLIQADQKLEILLEKTDLLGNSITSTVKSNLSLEPILNRVEGFAYSKTNNVLANANVNIRLNMSQKPYYQTKTNAQGYFTVEKKNLPALSYSIDIIPTTGTANSLKTNMISYHPSEFVKKNLHYLTQNQINLVTGEKTNAKIKSNLTPTRLAQTSNHNTASRSTTNDTSNFSANLGNNFSGNLNSSNQPNPKNSLSHPNSGFVVIIITILLLVITAAIIIWFFILHKKNEGQFLN